MDIKQIKQIIDLMKRSELSEFAFEEDGFKLKIRRELQGLPVVSHSLPSAPPFPVSPAPQSATPAAVAQSAAGEKEDPNITYIKSPMVGTFYNAPSPDSKVFVDPSSKVEENTVVCIIEAMKIMNEIQAEEKGTIVEVLVENGQPVEYGQKLFKLKKG